MLPAVFGVSLSFHIIIIIAVKAKNFLIFAFGGRARPRQKNKISNRAFTSMAIAVITEFVAVLVIVSSLAVLSAGITSNRSNYKIIKNAFNEIESNTPLTQLTKN